MVFVPLPHLDYFLFQTLCCWFAAGFIVLVMTQFQPNFSCQTDDLTFDSRTLWYTEEFVVDAGCPGPVADKPKSSALHHRASQLVRGVFTETLCLVLVWSAMCCFQRENTFSCNLSKRATLIQSFSKCSVMNFNI